MSRRAWILLALAAAVSGARPAAVGPCDMKTPASLPWCEKCKKEIDKKDIKKNACPTCKGKLKLVEFCVKKGYRGCTRGCHPGIQPAPCECNGQKNVGEPVIVKARTERRCEKCGGVAAGPGLCEQGPCRAFSYKAKKFCGKSGTSPPHHPLRMRAAFFPAGV